jgi:hypothetical protein
VVTVDGEPVVIDPGIGTYTDQTFGPGRFELWTTRSGYHNVPIVDGIEQPAGKEVAASAVHCDDAEDLAVLALELTGAYPARAGIESWARRVVLERDLGVAVTDAWQLSHAGRVELTLMLRDEPTMTPDGSELVVGKALIKFEPPSADIQIMAVALDDPTLVANWDRDRLWRARAIYPDAASGTVATTIRRLHP